MAKRKGRPLSGRLHPPKKCPKCKRKIYPYSLFCPSCGYRLS